MYCSQAQIEARVPELATAYAAKPEKWTVIINEAIGWAQSEIDFALSNRYSVPFSIAPQQIEQIAADLAAHFVLTSSFSAGGEDKPPALSETYLHRAKEKLDALAAGKASIPSQVTTDVQTGYSVGYSEGVESLGLVENMAPGLLG